MMVHFKTRQIEEVRKVTIATADKIAVPAHFAYYSARDSQVGLRKPGTAFHKEVLKIDRYDATGIGKLDFD
jgi:hypothetical protein